MSHKEKTVLIHDKALCESEEIGEGTRVWAFAQVMPGAVIGRDCNICGQVYVEGGAVIGDRVTVKNGVQVWDGVMLGDDVFVGPGVTFTNDLNPRAAFKKDASGFLPTSVAAGATIGGGAVVVCGNTLGEGSFVGAGAVVTKDVAAYALVVGNPARRRAWICVCGTQLDPRLQCQCGRGYRLVDEENGLVLLP